MAALVSHMSISMISSIFSVLYTGLSLTSDSVNNHDFSSQKSAELIRRCTYIIEDLEQLSPEFLATGRGIDLQKYIYDAICWSKEYEKKSSVKKILFSDAYKSRFEEFYRLIDSSYENFIRSLTLSKFNALSQPNISPLRKPSIFNIDIFE